MYYNHNLRTNLQEWKNRLVKSGFEQFGHQLKYFLNNLDNNPVIAGILNEAAVINQYPDERLEKILKERDRSVRTFNSEADQATYCIMFLKYLVKGSGNYNIHRLTIFYGRDFSDTKNNIVEELISPLVYFLHDQLEKSSSTIFLLEKYKKRVEWFTKAELLKKYLQAAGSYEQIFEDDLRMFLFDQGIDYPFSTPKSTSGRADIVGAIDTTDPVVLEIKILDKAKGYGKNRIRDGFSQILRYANDYNKDIGYLVVFNVDNTEINFNFSEPTKIFPPKLTFNNKTFFFIVVNVFESESASKLGTLSSIDISEAELIN